MSFFSFSRFRKSDMSGLVGMCVDLIRCPDLVFVAFPFDGIYSSARLWFASMLQVVVVVVVIISWLTLRGHLWSSGLCHGFSSSKLLYLLVSPTQ